MLQQLIALREITEKRSFRLAAESLNLSQPALTLRIQSLENRLGFQLLNRDKNGVTLTPEGERFLPYARSAIKAVQDGTAEARRARHYSAVYRVITSYVLMNEFVPNWLKLMRARRPDVALSIDCGYPDAAARLLTAGLVDVALTFEPIKLAGLSSDVLCVEKLVLATSCARVEDWRECYTYVYWDDQFTEQHRTLFDSDMNNPSITMVSVDAARLLALHMPLSGYMSERSIRPYLHSGLLKLVPGMPSFEKPVFVTSWSKTADDGAHRDAMETLRSSILED